MEPPGPDASGAPHLEISVPSWPLPEACRVPMPWDAERETLCYNQVAALTAEHGDYHCMGSSDHLDEEGSDEHLVFHTLSLGESIPPSAALLLYSFLATQCCDAQLHVWMRPGSVASVGGPMSTLFSLNAAHGGHRLVFKELSMEEAWEPVREEMEAAGVNASIAVALLAEPWPAADVSASPFGPARFLSDWLRLLVLYEHGGVYVDIDTVFLRDWRPLFAPGLLPFAPRRGVSANFDNAVLRLPHRPHALTSTLLAETLKVRERERKRERVGVGAVGRWGWRA